MGGVQIVTTVLKLMPLIAIIVLGLWLLATADATVIKVQPQPFTIAAINASAALTLWALLGLESATVPAGTVENPRTEYSIGDVVGDSDCSRIYVLDVPSSCC